ncbi:Hypothetical protein CINCED_3A002890 [Cinara cedri]|uniref:H(+)/Cl(-) exchange transporter 7 n=1 Tax=Cinara cedri TaxID=506608 RepID=A0A5E4NDM3_9HEMI|nr:Hypothetical protein CINCED_3A002890 [Cinara cedri]
MHHKSINNFEFATHILNYHWPKSTFTSTGVGCMNHGNNDEGSCRSTSSDILAMDSVVKPRAHSINYVSSDYESLDYENYESELTVREEKLNGYKTIVASNVIRWLIYFSIAICTATVGICIDTVIEYLCNWKYQSIRNYIDVNHSTWQCLMIWLLFTVLPTIVGCCVVLFMEPSAAGSGIPFVISYLNGIRIPRMTAVRCLFVKVVSVVCVSVAGLGGGKEGPLIHIGAMVGGSVVEAWWKGFRNSRGKKVIGPLQNDRERRDMMAAGAAAGLSAAFGAPVGGTLMSLEEGTSFWSSSLMWKVFFCAAIAFPTYNAGKTILNASHINGSESAYIESLYFFGKFNETTIYFSYSEFPIFIIFGIVGGGLGAIFVEINYRLSVLRMKHLLSNRKKLLEAVCVAMFVAIISITSMLLLNYCQLKISSPNLIQMNCPAGSYNEIGSFWLHTQEENIRSLFHYPLDAFSIVPLLVYCVIYFILTELTVGLNLSAGLFLPSLLIGAAWGRVASIIIHYYVPDLDTKNDLKMSDSSEKVDDCVKSFDCRMEIANKINT